VFPIPLSHQTPADISERRDHGLPDPHLAADPAVLLVNADAIDLIHRLKV
jgi:hypothetical protein